VLNEDDRTEVERLLADADHSAGVILLPESVDEDGEGIYDLALTPLSKVLQADNAAVSWAQERERRSYIERRSAADII
jgi:hypothetical protein